MSFYLLISRRFSDLRQTHFTPILNSKIKALVQQGQYTEALSSYTREPHFPLNSTKFTFPPLLKACVSLPSLKYGNTIHATILALGLQFDQFITTSLINMYLKCGEFSHAVQVFANTSKNEVLARDVTVWNCMIDGFLKYGFIEEGVGQFRRMQILGVRPDGYSLSIVLGVCSCFEGKQIHGFVIRNMLDDDPFVLTALIDMYSSFGQPIDAWNIFEKWGEKENVAVWNVMIRGFFANGLWENSLQLYSMMKSECGKLVSATFSSTLTACCHSGEVEFGRQVHCDLIKMGFHDDPFVLTAVLTMYAKCGQVKDAENVFNSVKDKEVELWNAMISAHVGNGCVYRALDLYNRMKFDSIKSDSFTMSNIFTSCGEFGLCDFGMAVQAELIKRPIQNSMAVQTALLTMYSKCGKIKDANTIFSAIKKKDVVSWGSLLSGFCQNKHFKETLEFFKEMLADDVKPDSDIMASLIIACMELDNIKLGFGIHGFVIKNGLGCDAFVANSLINMYSRYRHPVMAREVFCDLPHKNLVVCNSLITCCCRNGLPEQSISLLPQLVWHGLYPDNVSIIGVLSAVSSMASLLRGKIIHGYKMKFRIPADIRVENALIDMYIKCGCIKYAQNIFLNMLERNLVTWNTIIYGYGTHGECLKAINLFNEMRMSGINPDDVTFLSLISSCNHSGLIDKGLYLFHLMREYLLEPRMEHYVNIVDMLGRAGRLDDALSFIERMPIEADRNVWLCLLSACRTHRNIELGELAARNLLKIEPGRGSNYVQLLNLYVEAGLEDKAANLRASLRLKGLKKSPGCSWIEVRNKVDVFFSGDSSSPQTVKIYATLKGLRSNMHRKGDNDEAFEAL